MRLFYWRAPLPPPAHHEPPRAANGHGGDDGAGLFERDIADPQIRLTGIRLTFPNLP